jgi:hypothetical protein
VIFWVVLEDSRIGVSELGTLSGNGTARHEVRYQLSFQCQWGGGGEGAHFQKIGLNAIDAAATDFSMSSRS